jgi:hypothetical protein
MKPRATRPGMTLGMTLALLGWAGAALAQEPGQEIGEEPGQEIGEEPGQEIGEEPGQEIGEPEDSPDALPAELIDEIDVPPEIGVTAAASASEVMLGAVFSVFVTVTHPPGMHVTMPASLPLGDSFEASRRVTERRTRPDGAWYTEFELEVIAWRVGDIRVPPLPVTYSMAGTIRAAHSPAVPIQVIGLAGADSHDIRDIAQPVIVARRDFTAVHVILALAVLGVVAAAIWGGARMRGRRAPHAGPLPRPSAEREALERLDALEASGALAAEDRKPAYQAMSEIVRAYLGQRFGIPALDATTSELERALASRSDAALLGELLAPWLQGCDLVKYAGASASEQDARQALQTARRAVEMSSPGPHGQEIGQEWNSSQDSGRNSSQDSSQDSGQEQSRA